jgi:hypothetical protein
MSRELKTVNGEIRQQDQARIMQLEFKKQVQEWQNILLRGHDAVDREKHRRRSYGSLDRTFGAT